MLGMRLPEQDPKIEGLFTEVHDSTSCCTACACIQFIYRCTSHSPTGRRGSEAVRDIFMPNGIKLSTSDAELRARHFRRPRMR